MVGYTDQPELIISDSSLSAADVVLSEQCPTRQAWFELLQLSLDAIRDHKPFYLH